MTWLGKWIQIAGAWFGSDEPEAPGAMRATLRGSSSVSGSLDYQSEPIPADMSADLHGSSSVSLRIPEPASGISGVIRKIRAFWQPPAIPINIQAHLSGSGTVSGNQNAVAGMVAGLSGSGTIQGKQTAGASVSARLSGSGKANGTATAGKHLPRPVVADMSARITAGGALKGRINAVHHQPPPHHADNRADDELTMILLLAA